MRLLAVHETAQEEVIYPLVRSAEPGGDDIADDRLQEQSNAKNMLSDLERIGVASDKFAPRFAALRDAVLRHTESEEHTVLPLLEKAQDQASSTAWGRPSGPRSRWHPRIQRRRTRQCSRNMALGPLAAIVDGPVMPSAGSSLTIRIRRPNRPGRKPGLVTASPPEVPEAAPGGGAAGPAT